MTVEVSQAELVEHVLVETHEAEIEAMLPGSQCGQCGYPGCTPAATALANGEADVTLCPPGGRSLAQELANKLGISADLSKIEDRDPMIARIRAIPSQLSD